MAENEAYEISEALLKHIRIDGGKRYFITDAGEAIGLKPVSLVHVTRYQMEYKKNNPPPVPPIIEVEMGLGNKKEKGYQYFSNDPYYLELVSEYETDKNLAYIMFLIRQGTTAKVPEGYEPMFETSNELDIRADYVSSLLITQDDTQYFIEAVSSQNMITEAAIKVAEAAFRRNGSGPSGAGVPVLAETGQGYTSHN